MIDISPEAILPGSPHPLGATWDGRGTNFAVWSGEATRIELWLFAETGTNASRHYALPRFTDGVWHGYLPQIGPGQRYGYRAYGAYAPELGQRFNPHKLLLDPYARAIDRPALFHELLNGALDATRPDVRDNASIAPRSLVIDPQFDWQGDAPPRTPWRDTLIYECHVKSMTALHPDLPLEQRGRFLGLAHESVIAHLQALGVTAVELLPVHHAYSERFLVERGLVNYWGYNSVGFFAPDARFASASDGTQVREWKSMVRALHRAGIEVLIDVVYNHTGEADALGPSVCLRGFGNSSYYRLEPDDPSRYVDYTGCGHTLNLEHPASLRLVADSLRYWVEEMHVDGFRIDLAPALVRTPNAVAVQQGLFALLAQDPCLSRVKLIVEPWDVIGQELGRFAPGFAEWNDRYRDCVRRFFRGDRGQCAELATRIAGSADLFAGTRRTPQASINFVTCHDGFTLRDLTSYERAHNEANGWNGSDGARENLSRNYGIEGPSGDPRILEERDTVARSMLALLSLSLGVPMLNAGDELGRTQRGNNNPYSHDDATSYLSWQLSARERTLLEHARHCFAVRRALAVFRRNEHFRGESLAARADAPASTPSSSAGRRDVEWYGADGRELGPNEWADSEARSLLVSFAGHDPEGRADALRPRHLLALNGGDNAQRFVLPAERSFRVLVDSANAARQGALVREALELSAHALCLLEASARGGSAP